jgi:hypothetical protein
MNAYTGGGNNRHITFEDIDQQYRLKIRGFIGLCMPAIFKGLEQDLDLDGLRADGTVPIMYYLTFEASPNHLAFKGRIDTEHAVRLCHSVQPNPKDASGPPIERMLVDMHIDIRAQSASYDPHALGGGAINEETVPAGRMRGVHVLTRPTAPAGQRGVSEVPRQLRDLKVHPWTEPYPSAEGLQEVPDGFQAVDAGPWREQRSVWGLNNTDINQHVNVHEYIINIENHLARVLHGADLSVPEHRVERTDILFRKPAFMGDVHEMRGDLYTRGEQTLFLGGFYAIDADGRAEARPSVFARMTGTLSNDVAGI